MTMERFAKIGLGVLLLVVSSLIVMYASVTPSSGIIVGAIVVASLGLAAGALLVGASGSEGRVV